jgi:hypothetical protein
MPNQILNLTDFKIEFENGKIINLNDRVKTNLTEPKISIISLNPYVSYEFLVKLTKEETKLIRYNNIKLIRFKYDNKTIIINCDKLSIFFEEDKLQKITFTDYTLNSIVKIDKNKIKQAYIELKKNVETNKNHLLHKRKSYLDKIEQKIKSL